MLQKRSCAEAGGELRASDLHLERVRERADPVHAHSLRGDEALSGRLRTLLRSVVKVAIRDAQRNPDREAIRGHAQRLRLERRSHAAAARTQPSVELAAQQLRLVETEKPDLRIPAAQASKERPQVGEVRAVERERVVGLSHLRRSFPLEKAEQQAPAGGVSPSSAAAAIGEQPSQQQPNCPG